MPSRSAYSRNKSRTAEISSGIRAWRISTTSSSEIECSLRSSLEFRLQAVGTSQPPEGGTPTKTADGEFEAGRNLYRQGELDSDAGSLVREGCRHVGRSTDVAGVFGPRR